MYALVATSNMQKRVQEEVEREWAAVERESQVGFWVLFTWKTVLGGTLQRPGSSLHPGLQVAGLVPFVLAFVDFFFFLPENLSPFTLFPNSHMQIRNHRVDH